MDVIMPEEIYTALRTQRGTISPKDYAKFIGKLQDMGFITKTERPHEEIRVRDLVEKLRAFNKQGGTADQMRTVLQYIGIEV